MFIVGVTGSLGTGKSSVAKLFKGFGARVLDADQINHALLARKGKCFKAVIRVFGPEILTKAKIDRRKLAKIVFQNPTKLKKLCSIIHPAVAGEIKKELAFYRQGKTKNKTIIIDAPLLIEAGWRELVDILVVVKTNRTVQVKRILWRKKIKKSEALRRIQAQMPLKEKIALADIVVNNNGNFNTTKRQVRNIWQKLQRMAEKVRR